LLDVVSDSDIDAAILAVAKTSWRKVALIFSQAAKHISADFDAREDAYRLVARRIHALVADGRLEAQGDLEKWRHSEIRLV
jgi:hypothetical protein